MIAPGPLSNEFLAILIAAVASSLLMFLALAASGWIGAPAELPSPLDLLVFLSILLIWAPAFALVPAGILGFLLERPLARRLLARPRGGFLGHFMTVIAAAFFLWLLLRIAVVLSGPQSRILDPLSLVAFLIIGVSSALSWWFLVIEPGRRAQSDRGPT
ncbi:MAG TPA: hypothetical protein VFK50_03320 [Sphingomicrobium sp.]|nr:hypothetical protein [Sphingomicrobium sp.]